MSPLLWNEVTPSSGTAMVLAEDWLCFNEVLAEDLCHTAAASYDDGSNVSTVVNVPMVTLFFFLPFIPPPLRFLGMVAVAATIFEVFWDMESVGGDDEEEFPSMSLPLMPPLPFMLPTWFVLKLSNFCGTTVGPKEWDFRLFTLCIWAVLVGGIGGKEVGRSKDLSVTWFWWEFLLPSFIWDPFINWAENLRLSPLELSILGSVLEFWE